MINEGYETLIKEPIATKNNWTLYYYRSNVKPFSEFRRHKLQQEIEQACGITVTLDAELVYMVGIRQVDASNVQVPLKKLLNAQPVVHFNKTPMFWVVPRFGTTSPWASKVLDMINVCGFSCVEKIEHALVYYIHPIIFSEKDKLKNIAMYLHDQMTETVCYDVAELQNIFEVKPPKKDSIVEISKGISALGEANNKLGLSLSSDEVQFLFDSYSKIQRAPSYSELMMFAQVNSEHCRHKIFNATWANQKEQQPYSLFDMIRYTYQQQNQGILSAYKDNGAILEGNCVDIFFADENSKTYQFQREPAHIVIKAETHNHPTAISPYAGAATSAGGEIRDEGATGIGAKPKAALTGFTVSHLHIPDFSQPWEENMGYPAHIASSLEIMLEGPIGAAAFNNEFGRPNLLGYFRTFQYRNYGYHKPIMIAGGIGTIRASATHKKPLSPDAELIVLGGPAMLIGLGGGAASSVASGSHHANLDFASVQRANPEMQRRCQEVINACWSMDDNNPILSIHDVGAGGLANALSELVHDNNLGGKFELRSIPNADKGMSPMEIWCNEAQERYVLAIHKSKLAVFEQIAKRERCPFAVIGKTTHEPNLILTDAIFNQDAVNVPLSLMFGNAPKLQKTYTVAKSIHRESIQKLMIIEDCIERVLQFPTVANKSFLITIGDRSVTGLVARDQMVGPWQVPVADVAVTASSFNDYCGEAMAMGERTPLALISSASAARMAVAEAITNIAAARIANLSDIKLSANWMAACKEPGEESALYDAVKAVGLELCPALGICIPVGKDSLSMQMLWKKEEEFYKVTSPVSLIVSAFANVVDIRHTLTPQLITNKGATLLLLIDLGQGQNRLGGSALAQVHQQLGDKSPDLNHPQLLIDFFNVIQNLQEQKLILAYHDRSDGGLLTTLCEMSFAGYVGVTLDLPFENNSHIPYLFNEELGAVIQILEEDLTSVLKIFEDNQLRDVVRVIGQLNENDELCIRSQNAIIYRQSRMKLQRIWSEISYRMQSLRDNPICAQQEFELLLDAQNPGIQIKETFDPNEQIIPPFILKNERPRVAVLREQGVNGHVEMAAAFDRAGFLAIDVHMTDILSGKVDLQTFKGIVACGGFSYGDVLGAGQGWANSILFNSRAHHQFSEFFARNDSFTLGVCNGCQMLSHLKDLIPGTERWPYFKRNISEQFEARFSLVAIRQSPSIFFTGMEGAQLPITVAHGEGRVEFIHGVDAQHLVNENLVPMQYVNNYGQVTEDYPHNPNGSVLGITALTNKDGRVTIMMPHPERVFRTVQHSWHPEHWQENSPWFRLFANARLWVE